MATTRTIHDAPDRAGAPARSARLTAGLLVGAGVLLLLGGRLHPHGEGTSIDSALLSMLGSPRWPLAHALLLAGMTLGLAAFVAARRGGVLGSHRLLTVTVVAWAVGTVETVPHLLASADAHALAAHRATPLLDIHLALQLLASPLVGLTTAVLAVAVARSAGTWPARILAVLAVAGGAAYAVAPALILVTGDPAWSGLFALLALLALWLVGTGVRVLHR